MTQARGVTLFVFLALAIPAAMFAAKANPGEPQSQAPALSDASISTSAIQWSASGPYERLTLTVNGPEGFTLNKEFAAGQGASLRLADLGVKADGAYTWQLRVVPRISAETKAQLAAARANDDDAAIARIRAEAHIDQEIMESGTATIQNGTTFAGRREARPAPAGPTVG